MSKKLIFALFLFIVFILAGAGALYSALLKPSAPPNNQKQASLASSIPPANSLSKKGHKQKRHLVVGTPKFTKAKKLKSSILEQYAQKQWALKDISALKAWEETKGDRNIVVAVIDTGVHTEHSCLKPNLWVNKGEIPGNGKDDDGNGYVDDIHGWNFADGDNNIQDYHGHGTHIAGVIAATGATPEAPNCKMIGVAPEASLMILKYYDESDSSKNLDNTVKSIEYAIKNGAHIINYSGGGPGENPEEKRVVALAADKKILFVAAAGNDGSKIEKGHLEVRGGKKSKDFKYYPASYGFRNILFVQSKNERDEIIDSSNWVKVGHKDTGGFKRRSQTAPGEDIISTMPPRRYLLSQTFLSRMLWRTIAAADPSSQDAYGHMTGTSQATAVATGVAVLVKSYYKGIGMEQVIEQVARTGFGRGTEKIKRKTNQGKKLDAYQALIMRHRAIDTADSLNDSDAIMATDAKALKNLKEKGGKVDVYGESQDRFEAFSEIRKMSEELSSPDPEARKKALLHFGKTKYSSDLILSKVRSKVRQTLSDPNPEIRELAAVTLKKITPKDSSE